MASGIVRRRGMLAAASGWKTAFRRSHVPPRDARIQENPWPRGSREDTCDPDRRRERERVRAPTIAEKPRPRPFEDESIALLRGLQPRSALRPLARRRHAGEREGPRIAGGVPAQPQVAAVPEQDEQSTQRRRQRRGATRVDPFELGEERA